jgi:bacterial/archaeal transporter family protein
VKTYVVLVLAALSGAVGETFFSYGMRRFGAMDLSSPARWLDLLLVVPRNLHVLTGVIFAAGFFFLYLTALSWVDLSFAMPLTALSFVFATLLSRFVLGEQVSWHRWVGTVIIVAGVSFVALDRNTRTVAPTAGPAGVAAGADAR